MNQDQVMSIIRAVLQIAGTALVSHGVVSDSDWSTAATEISTIAGAVLVLIPIGWSMFVHSTTGKMLAVADMPEVKRVVVDDPNFAESIPSGKVVSR